MTVATHTAPEDRSGLRAWWTTGLPPELKFVYLVLLANGVPAFAILLSIPDRTENWFVWTVEPVASARLLGVMYGNALLLVIFGFVQGSWLGARITAVVVTFFAIAATISTFFNLGPFLDHPWTHLAYWLLMYLVLCVAAPVALVVLERRFGGRHPVLVPLTTAARTLGAASAVLLFILGISLIAKASYIYDGWPWELTPITGGMIGVWFTGLALAFCWALWDGDWLRVRPIFWQAVPTGATLAFIPLVHRQDIRDNPEAELAAYLSLAIGVAVLHLGVIILQQRQGSGGVPGAGVLSAGVLSLDVVGLAFAGLVNTFLSPIVSELMLADGLRTQVQDIEERIAWVATHAAQWQAGWTFWFVVTLSFAWSYYALGRNLGGPPQWRYLAIGLAMVAAAVDIVGLVTNITVVPYLAHLYESLDPEARPDALLTYGAFEAMASDLIYVAAFGLYSVAGLILVPAVFLTPSFPRLLAWLGAGEWTVACVATVLLGVRPDLAYGPLVLSFLLFAPWVWGSAWWLHSQRQSEPALGADRQASPALI